jgi:hypothetical protein
MTKSHHPPTRHPFLRGPGHWEGDLDERGQIVDRWIRHCERHPDHELRPTCAICAKEGVADDSSIPKYHGAACAAQEGTDDA